MISLRCLPQCGVFITVEVQRKVHQPLSPRLRIAFDALCRRNTVARAVPKRFSVCLFVNTLGETVVAHLKMLHDVTTSPWRNIA
jgi:hypothetical protein